MENTLGRNIIPGNDKQRIDAVKRYRILDTPPEEEFDNIVKLATTIFKVPMSLISLVDAERVFFKAGAGENANSPRGDSFCAMAIMSPQVTVIENAPDDPCLLANPAVAGEFGLKFYAGAPLITDDNFHLGTICVLDKKARKFTKDEEEILTGLSKVVMRNIEIRLAALRQTEEYEQLLEEQAATNEELTASNEELRNAQEDLESTNNELEDRVAERTRAQAESKARLEQIINQMPAHVLILSGPDMIIESVNDAVTVFWQKNRKKIVGKRLLTVLPELKGQAFPEQLDEVFTTGKTIAIKESPVELQNDDGSIRKAYVDYSYQAIMGGDGKPSGILVMSFEVTDKVESRELLEKYAAELQQINEEIGASNEELMATNEELAEAQATLKKTIVELAISEANFLSVILQSPVAMGLCKGPDMVLEVINDKLLELWGKDKSIIGRTLLNGVPELEGQPYLGIMQEVLRTARPYYGTESQVYLQRNGNLEEGYFNFINHPFMDDNGMVTGIIVVAIEVTEQVRARMKLQKAEETLRLAIEGAKIGSWYIDPQTKALNYNATLAKIFGYEGPEPMTYDQAIAQVTEEYRTKILTEREDAITTGADYDIIYTQRRFNDGEIIWLRSLGKIMPDDNGDFTIFSGVVMDITEQKRDDLRKNDFIGMVSHELKTPLTSLTALIQMAQFKLKNSEDQFLPGAMDKANNQVKKMSAMINGFLNISRLESGKLLIDKTEFEIDNLIEDVIHEIELTSPGHYIRLLPCTPVKIFADHDKIGSVISNLVSNAVKYSPKGSAIEIGCQVMGKQVQISIKDEGMGIKSQDQEKLFDRYYRVDNQNTQHISGFGIGLYLSAEIIQRHNGKIWVESVPDKGSTFYFSLPLV